MQAASAVTRTAEASHGCPYEQEGIGGGLERQSLKRREPGFGGLYWIHIQQLSQCENLIQSSTTDKSHNKINH